MGELMRIYLASRYSRITEMRNYTAQLAEIGHEVTSRWVHRAYQIVTDEYKDDLHHLEARCAEEDLEDLRAAECIICFSEPPRSTTSRGGRHVEFGAAVAWGTRLILVGPRENVFHYVPQVEVYETWEELRQFLQNDADIVANTLI